MRISGRWAKPTLRNAQKYYSPVADNEFAKILRATATRVGSEFFRWEAVPVCSQLERFDWNGTTILPQFDQEQRNAYLAQFLRVLISYCQ